MEYTRPRDPTAVKTDGTTIAPDKDGNIVFPGAGTWFIELGSANSWAPAQTIDISVILKWSATLAGALTFEWTNWPETKSGTDRAPVDVATNENAGTGFWLQDGLASGVNATAVIGVGNSFAAPTLTLGGANAGAWGVQLSDRSARRYRLKLVATAGGTLRVGIHGKLGA